ncbi:MAG: YccF domain-containing protein, partial [Bacteroidales bacterium]|nr:YccF domain-containing protein [Bacteroidales bacterium]
IVGIPFAKAHWRLMKLSMMPFGTVTIPKRK